MKASITFLLVMLSAVATPASAEWTEIGKNQAGTQYFIDLTTLKKSARPRAWVMASFSKRSELGIFSAKTLDEIDCSEGKIRALARRYYTEPMGGGTVESDDRLGEWRYVTPNSAEEHIASILCRDNR
jgi:hypothetical protein